MKFRIAEMQISYPVAKVPKKYLARKKLWKILHGEEATCRDCQNFTPSIFPSAKVSGYCIRDGSFSNIWETCPYWTPKKKIK